jgi:predicted 2-oxoglutarate/Fe(II)-dependent dioxygenase YbiX/peroxiredoxin
MKARIPGFGEPAPWFIADSSIQPKFNFDSLAGRIVVLCFVPTCSDQQTSSLLSWVQANPSRFSPDRCVFFVVTADREDQDRSGALDGVNFFWDFDRQLFALYGLCDTSDNYGRPHQTVFVLDQRLRVASVFHVAQGASAQSLIQQIDSVIEQLETVDRGTHQAGFAPVLIVPRVFEPKLCGHLIEYYHQHGGQESGFMRDIDGRTVAVQDATFKRRRDQEIVDPELRNACMYRIHDRLLPEILKAFQFQATRIERYIVANYDSDFGGHFRPHRDNTTKGTAHRRFAVSINLNTGQYEGGKLCFPEFGPRLYEPPLGGALVFSCSLLHQATPVSSGARFVFLPFLYDDPAAKIREKNRGYLA